MFFILTSAATSATAFIYPALTTFKALRSGDVAQQTFCLMYWTILACFLFVEHWTYYVVSWVPLYAEIKLVFFLWLVLPQTQGATYLYLEYLSPYVALHEHEIDDTLQRLTVHARRFGGDAIRTVVVWCGDILFGAGEKEFRQRAAGIADSSDGRPIKAGDAAGWTFSSLVSKVSTLSAGDHVTSSLRNLLAMANRQAPVPEQALEALIPPHLEGPQRQRYVQQQKTRLQQMLAMLESTTSATTTNDDASTARSARSSGVESPRRPASSGSSTNLPSTAAKRSVSTPAGLAAASFLQPSYEAADDFEVIQELEGSRSASPGKRLSTADDGGRRRSSPHRSLGRASGANSPAPAAVGRGEATPGSSGPAVGAHDANNATATAPSTTARTGTWFWRSSSSSVNS